MSAICRFSNSITASLSQILLSGCAKLVIQGGEVFASLMQSRNSQIWWSRRIRRNRFCRSSRTTRACRHLRPNLPSGDLNVETLRARRFLHQQPRNRDVCQVQATTGEKSRVLHENAGKPTNGLFVSRSDARNAAGSGYDGLSCLLLSQIAVLARGKDDAGTRFALFLPSSIAIRHHAQCCRIPAGLAGARAAPLTQQSRSTAAGRDRRSSLAVHVHTHAQMWKIMPDNPWHKSSHRPQSRDKITNNKRHVRKDIKWIAI